MFQPQPSAVASSVIWLPTGLADQIVVQRADLHLRRFQLRHVGAVGCPGGDRLLQHRFQLCLRQRRHAAGAWTVGRELRLRCPLRLERRRLRPVAGDELVAVRPYRNTWSPASN